MDKILTIFDHPPTSSGRPWTYQWPPTYVHVDIHVPISWNQSICTLKFRSLMKVVILFVIYNWASKTCELPILMMLGSGPNLGNKFFTKNFLLLAIFGSLVLNLSGILSTWTFELPPTYLTWTIVDIWSTTHPPNLVHVVCEWPLNGIFQGQLLFKGHG